MHFHPYQDEYIEILEGQLGLDLDGVSCIVSPDDGEICTKAWTHHQLYPPPNDGSKVTKFILSGAKTQESYRLDILLFSNWYRYQDDVVLNGRSFDIIQVMSVRLIPPS